MGIKCLAVAACAALGALTSWFSHLAIETNPKTNKNTWLEPVSDADYQGAMR